FSIQAKAARTDVDFILEWGGHQGRVLLHRLIADPEKNEVQLRQFLSNIDRSNAIHVYFAEEVSEALKKIEQERANLPKEQGEQPGQTGL
ncbi:MAG: hypothetical protein D3910_27465, partial [Candidatus Electrothrix sp. ATG2]|nr:hypothetical protein [Candidatus Electrothrix sp. ATG2]